MRPASIILYKTTCKSQALDQRIENCAFTVAFLKKPAHTINLRTVVVILFEFLSRTHAHATYLLQIF